MTMTRSASRILVVFMLSIRLPGLLATLAERHEHSMHALRVRQVVRSRHKRNRRFLVTSSVFAPTVISGFNTTGQWLSASVNRPAALAQYDLQFASTAGGTTFSVHAASLYPYET